MDHRNARRVSNLGKRWPKAIGWEFPEVAEWDQLLTKLGLNDSQALDAVKSEGEKGDQLRSFVLKCFKQYFVPEAVLNAVGRRRKQYQLALSLAEIV
jgi:hypothetical protein